MKAGRMVNPRDFGGENLSAWRCSTEITPFITRVGVDRISVESKASNQTKFFDGSGGSAAVTWEMGLQGVGGGGGEVGGGFGGGFWVSGGPPFTELQTKVSNWVMKSEWSQDPFI